MLILARRRLIALALLFLGLTSSARAARWVELSPADTTRPLARAAHSVVLDGPGRRLIAWGDRVPEDEIWALPLDGPANWIRLRAEGTPPPPRELASVIFDPVRRRMVVFAGGGGEGGYPTSNETWTLALDGTPRWEKLAVAGTSPVPRELHSAIYDPVRDRMLVFGGLTSTYENSVWELTLGDTPTWRPLAPVGTPPSPRIAASMVYDAARDRALVFGGDARLDPGQETYRNDVYELSLGDAPAWRKLAPTGIAPAPRYEQAAVMDDGQDRLLVFGGRGHNVLPLADAWALDLSVDPPAWRRAGPDAAFPRYEAVAVLDPVTNRLVVDGGFCGQGGGYFVDETIALDLGAPPVWHALGVGTPSAPARRISPVPLVDPVTRQLLLEGGYDYYSFGEFSGYARMLSPPDVWAWPLDSATPAWTKLPSAPGKFTGPGRAVLDPVRSRQVRFFQDMLDPVHASSVGVLPLDVSGTWTALRVQGVEPPSREDFSSAYDPARDRILLAGGYVPDPRGHSRTPLRDLWSLSLSGEPTWTLLRPDGPDEPRVFPDALFYDPAGDQFVAVATNPGSQAGTWTLAGDGGSPWRFIAPLADAYEQVSFDPLAHELIVFGLDPAGEVWHHVLSDTAGWVRLQTTGEPPPARLYTRPEFDPVNRRVLLFGGKSMAPVGPGGYWPAANPLGDLWALELDRAQPSVSEAGPDRVRVDWTTNLRSGAAVTVERAVDEQGFAALAEASVDATGAIHCVDREVRPGLALDYRLRFAGTVLPGSEQHLAVSPRPPLALAGARPNPAVGATQLVFTLPGGSAAKIEVFDLAGRLMESRAVGGLGAGEHVLGLEKQLAPGLYVAVLSRAGQRLTRRFVVAR